MTLEHWIEIISSVLAGLAVTIPLVIQLVKYVQKAAKERNWNKLLELVMSFMREAETKFDNGADRKEWVLGSIAALSSTINYDIDYDVIGQMIDSICDLSKIVNSPEAG